MDKKTDTPPSENMAHMEEIEKNYQAFKRLLPTLMKYENHHALMRHEKVIGIYSTARDAVMTGKIFYEDGLFSVQEITARPADFTVLCSRALALSSCRTPDYVRDRL